MGLLLVASQRRDVGTLLLDFINYEQADLVMLATHQYDGFERMSHEIIAEPLVRRSCVHCLMLPQNSQAFVKRDDGAISLTHIVVPLSCDWVPI